MIVRAGLTVRFWLAVSAAAVLSQGSAAAQQVEEDSQETIEVTAPGSYRPEETPDLAAAARQIVRRTNRFREAKGLEPLETSPGLKDAAQYFADYMAEHDRYGHTADDQRPAERAKQAGYEYCIVAENIAYEFHTLGFTTQELAKSLFEAWKKSPEHRKNMLDADMTEIGVALAQSEKTGVFYAVQEFGRPRSAAFEFAIYNTAADTIEYEIGQRTFKLPPRFTRTHQVCRPRELSFLKGEKVQPSSAVASEAFRPQQGQRYTVQSDGEGTYTVERETGDAANVEPAAQAGE